MKRLVLRTEHLADLDTDALRAVAGGTHFCDLTHNPVCRTEIFTVPPTQCQITQTCTI